MFFVLWWDAQPMAAHPTTIQIESIHGIPRDNPPGTHFSSKSVRRDLRALAHLFLKIRAVLCHVGVRHR